MVGAFAATAFSQTNDEEARRIILGKKTGSTSTRTDRQDPRDVVLGGDRRVYDEQGNRYPSGTQGTREQRIDQVNREYDQKIYSIRNNPNLSSSEKERIIRQLEADRARKIKAINKNYDGRDRKYDDDDDEDYKKNKKYKKDNGNHYGWEKGVGNPHRTGSDKEYGHKSNGKGNSGKGKGKKD